MEAESHCRSHGLTKRKLEAAGMTKGRYDSVFANIKELQEDAESIHRVPKDWDPILGCPPVEGLYVVNGLKCKLCNQCVHKEKSMQNHFVLKHRGEYYSNESLDWDYTDVGMSLITRRGRRMVRKLNLGGVPNFA